MHPFFSLFLGCVIVEMLLYFAAPHLYAFTARFPFAAPRRLVVPTRALDALRAKTSEAASGYRTSAMGATDLARLEVPPRIDFDGVVLYFRLDRGLVVARETYMLGRRLFGLLRVDVRIADGALELRPRFILLGWPSLIGLAPVGVVATIATLRPNQWSVTFVTGALFIGINVVIGLLFARGRLEVGLREIERQLDAALRAAESEI